MEVDGRRARVESVFRKLLAQAHDFGFDLGRSAMGAVNGARERGASASKPPSR